MPGRPEGGRQGGGDCPVSAGRKGARRPPPQPVGKTGTPRQETSSASRRRFLPPDRSGPELELLEVGPVTNGKAPILCLHGAFGGAWMWTEAFLPAFARLGRPAAALSLRGHGGSQGRSELGHATLAEYGSDVLRAIDAFPEPPILVAHSLGGLLAQRLLGQRVLRALILLAPLPPDGMLLITPRLLATAPGLWFAMLDVLAGDHLGAVGQMRHASFSPHVAPEEVERFMSMMVAEGRSVLLEIHLPVPVASAFLLGIPALVLAGGRDKLVPADATMRTALYHWADRRVIDQAGHMIPLEPAAEEIACDIVGWLEARGL